MAEPYERLAVALSVAVRIEPELIRAVRLTLFPRFDVSAEADLWFSPLVQSRGPHGIVFDRDASARLRATLASWLRTAPPGDPVHRLGDVISSVHKRLSPALALEERVTWLAITGRDDGIDAELQPALKALVRENRSGVADWFVAAWHRLPPNVRQTVTAWKLAQVSRPDLSSSAPPLSLLRDTGDLDLADIVSVLPDARLLLHRNGNTLEIGDFEPVAGTVGIMVPDTDPRLLTIGEETVTVRRGSSTRITVDPGTLQVGTARGVVYEVAPPPPARGLLLVVDNSSEPVLGLPGDDYEIRRVLTPVPADDRDAVLGDLATTGANGGPLVICWQGREEPELGPSLADLMAAYHDAGGTQLLVLLQTPSLSWTTLPRGLGDRTPDGAWTGVVAKPMDAGEPLPLVLMRLLGTGPSTAVGRRRWPVTAERVTGRDVMTALTQETGDPEPAIAESTGGQPLPMFRNPLHGRTTPEATVTPWFDISAEIDEAVGWARGREGRVLVITGGDNSGKTTVLDVVGRDTSFTLATEDALASLVMSGSSSGQEVMIDDLDARTDPLWVEEITRLSREGTRFIVTLRRHSPLIDRLTASTSVQVIDLDDLRAHVIRRLSGLSSGMSAEAVATFLVDTENMSPALVRRTTRELREHPVPTHPDSDWQREVLGVLHAAFDTDLREDRTAQLLLSALAWAHGPGMPMAEWLACAHAVLPDGGDTFTENDAQAALRDFGHYASSNIRGHRLAHHSLAAYLKTSTDRETPRRIFQALADLVPTWGTPDNYLRGRLRDHAIEMGAESLPKLRELSSWNSAWRSDVGFVATALAGRATGAARIALARAAVEAYTEVITTERKAVTELRAALDFLEESLREDDQPEAAGTVWSQTLSDLPPSIASLLERRTNLPPTPKPREIRPNDLVVLVPGVKDNNLRGVKRFAPLPDGLGDDSPRGGPADAVLDPDGYGPMLELLRGLGYTEHRGNLLTLPYDWRLSYRRTGELLGERVEDALSVWRRKYRGNLFAGVVFICVTTGGLPVRWYVERCGGARITNGVITIGTPVRGSVRALEKLVNGNWRRGTADFWRSLPSSYQSLPVYDCVRQYDGLLPLGEAPVPGLDPARVADGVAFLTELIAAEDARPESLSISHPVVGVRLDTPTEARVAGTRLEVLDEAGAHGSGDSHVPEFAATHPDKTPMARVQATHELLHRDPGVLKTLAKVLRPAPVAPVTRRSGDVSDGA